MKFVKQALGLLLVGILVALAAPGMAVQWIGTRTGIKLIENMGTYMISIPGWLMFALSQTGK